MKQIKTILSKSSKSNNKSVLSKFYFRRLSNYFFINFLNFSLFKYFIIHNFILLNKKSVCKLLLEEKQSLNLLIY